MSIEHEHSLMAAQGMIHEVRQQFELVTAGIRERLLIDPARRAQ